MSRKLFNFLFIAVISFTIAMQPLSVSASSNETDGFFSNASLLEYIEKFLNKNEGN